MKCLYCSSEALPFKATGGLGDVAGSLPQALRQLMVGIRIVMPYYDEIPQEMKDEMRFITSFSVPVAWRRQYCGVFEARYKGVVYYLLDNQYYFKRQGVYGFYDDAERFAFFSRAALEMLPYIDFKPDIIHSNDWQTALIPVYYSLFYSNYDWYKGIKTIFTIHNIQYQGQYGLDLNEEVVGLPDYNMNVLEYDNCVNLMKAAIETSNRVNTVSPSYAQEIMDPWFAFGLDPFIRDRAWKISGILNGIDVDNYNAETDPNIVQNFTPNDFSGKAACKRALQERLCLELRPEVPMIGMVSRLVAPKGLDLVKEVIDEIMNVEDVQFVILGSGDAEYEDYFRSIQDKYPGKFCACFGFIPSLAREIYSAADIYLMPSRSEPCGLAQMIALRYATIPIVRRTGGLGDSIQDSGDGLGNGFVFNTYNAYDMYDAIKRAIAGYWDESGGWKILMKRAMECDNSWEKSAKEYLKLYKEVLSE